MIRMPRHTDLKRTLVFLALVALPFAGCGSDSRAATAPKSAATPAREVRLVPAVEERVPRTVLVTGTLAAEDQAVLSMKVAGRVNELLVDMGTAVRRGQPVARLDPTDFRLRVQQAEAALHQARARLGLPPEGTDDRVDLERTALVRQARAILDEARLSRDRVEQLARQELVARAQVDTAVANLLVAEGRYQDALEEVRNRQAVIAQRRSELEIARQQLVDTVLTAPFDGMVREKRTAVGEYLNAGVPVVTIIRTHPLRLAVAVPERLASSVRVGQAVRVSVEGDATTYGGRVVRLSPAIQEQNRSLNIEAEVPNERGALRPGSFAKAEIITAAEQPAVFVPASAIVTFVGIEKVLLVREGKSVERRVQTGRRLGDRVEILDGLKAGEAVIVAPGNLAGGQPVTVAR